LHDSVGWGREPAQEAMRNMLTRFQDFGSDAQAMALKQLLLIARQQGTVMAFADVFLMLAVLFVAFAGLAFVMQRPAPAAAAPAPH
jgi:DHA2 family multidrug resistance protein